MRMWSQAGIELSRDQDPAQHQGRSLAAEAGEGLPQPAKCDVDQIRCSHSGKSGFRGRPPSLGNRVSRIEKRLGLGD